MFRAANRGKLRSDVIGRTKSRRVGHGAGRGKQYAQPVLSQSCTLGNIETHTHGGRSHTGISRCVIFFIPCRVRGGRSTLAGRILVGINGNQLQQAKTTPLALSACSPGNALWHSHRLLSATPDTQLEKPSIHPQNGPYAVDTCSSQRTSRARTPGGHSTAAARGQYSLHLAKPPTGRRAKNRPQQDLRRRMQKKLHGLCTNTTP